MTAIVYQVITVISVIPPISSYIYAQLHFLFIFRVRKVIKVIAVTASKVKSNSSSAGVGIGGKTNNEIAQNEIAEKLDDIKDVEW